MEDHEVTQGPGGAETYIIHELRGQWSLLWLIVHYMADPSTNNNQAEYSALVK